MTTRQREALEWIVANGQARVHARTRRALERAGFAETVVIGRARFARATSAGRALVAALPSELRTVFENGPRT